MAHIIQRRQLHNAVKIKRAKIFLRWFMLRVDVSREEIRSEKDTEATPGKGARQRSERDARARFVNVVACDASQAAR